MSLAGLLNQTITIYTKSGYNAYGRESVSDVGNQIKARFQPKTKRVLEANGQVLKIDAICFVAATVSVNSDDKVAYGSEKYKVLAVYPVPGANGETHHKELQLIKWQET